MQFDSTTINMLIKGIGETFYMVLLSSALSYIIGIPLGIALVVTDKDGISPVPVFNRVLGVVINLLRSVPFIILLIMVIPITRLIVGKIYGSNATVVPLVISASPYIARMVESSLKEVDAGVIEAAKSMGAAISVTTILGYSAMAGFTGGGGLGDIAIRYGYHRYQTDMMLVTVVLLVIIVQLIQEIFMRMSRRSDKRIR